ncbi:MAG: flagellar basal-body MS-ring/collar protein FliF [Roseinatronobacter sp.]
MAAVWNKLDLRGRSAAVGGILLSLVLVLALARGASQPALTLLYAGLETAAAGEIVQTLEQRGVRYEVRGDSIFVPQPQRDELRMLLAASGLPANSVAGYELLDQLSGFGTTSQMFDAAYWRAKEGELARTIASSSLIRQARVHLAKGPGTVFRRDAAMSASVTVTPVSGQLTAMQARTIRHLVASAVAGMNPDDVAVIDSAGGLVYASEGDFAAGTGPSDRVSDLRRRVERILDAHVGFGRSVVEISVETVLDREVIRERRIDPDERVAVVSETEEIANSSTGPIAQGVTVAGNLPDGDAAANAATSESREAQNRVRNTFDVSETQREIERMPGAIRRLTVAVLIDGVQNVGNAGEPVWSPRPETELEALRDLVASAVGFDEARGDVITLRSLPFEPAPILGSEAGGGLFSSANLDVMTLAKWGFLLLAFLVLALLVVRPLLLAARGGRSDMAAGVAGLPALLPGVDRMADTTGRALPYDIGPELSDRDTAAPADPVARLRELITQRQTESVEALRHWIETSKEPTQKG